MENILTSSLAFSLLALVVLAFRHFSGEKYSRRLIRALWVVVILRMLFPFNFAGKLAVVQLPQNTVTERLLPSQSDVALTPNRVNETSATIGDKTIFEKPAEPLLPLENSSHDTVTLSVNPTPGLRLTDDVFLAVWIGGILISLLLVGLSYLKFRSELKRKLLPISAGLLESIQDYLGTKIRVFAIVSDESPMVVGVFMPTLILPNRLIAEIDRRGALSPQLQSVLRHEQAHIQHKDLLLKSLYLVGRAVQWFNPLVYLIQKPLNEDIEMAADEVAAEGMERLDRAAYCHSILEVADALPATANNYSTRFTGDMKTMKKRIEALLKTEKTRHGMAVLITVLIAAGLTIGLVSCQLEPYDQPALTAIGNLLTPADSCQDFYLTVGTEFEIELDLVNYPTFGDNPPSPLDTTGAIHWIGKTTNDVDETYRYQYRAVTPGTLTMIFPGKNPSENGYVTPASGALFSFIVLDDEEAAALGVERGQLVRPAALPELEKDYSGFSTEQLVREYYRLLDQGRPDQAYQLRFDGFRCQQTPTFFTRFAKASTQKTEVLSIQTKGENGSGGDELGDVPGVCERLVVKTQITGGSNEDIITEEVVFVKEDGSWRIASIGDPACCNCNSFHEPEQTNRPEPVSTVQYGELVLYQYSLDPLPNTDGALEPLTWEGDPVNAAQAGKPLRYLREKIVIGEHTYFAHCNPEVSDCIAQVEKDGEVIFEILSQNPQASQLVLGTIRGFWKLDDSWVLEVAREWGDNSDPTASVPVGEVYLNGELINERFDYDTAFEFQVLAGKPFFFFKRDGKLGFSYDWQEYLLPFESIHHYRCCSAGTNSPRHFENLVNFVVYKGRETQYYELVAQK